MIRKLFLARSFSFDFVALPFWSCNPNSSWTVVLVQLDFSLLEIAPSKEDEDHLPIFSCICFLSLSRCDFSKVEGASSHLNLPVMPWPVWLSWMECHPINWEFAGLTPSQGTYPGCGLFPQLGCLQEATNQCFSLSLSLSLSLSFLWKQWKKMSSGEEWMNEWMSK